MEHRNAFAISLTQKKNLGLVGKLTQLEESWREAEEKVKISGKNDEDFDKRVEALYQLAFRIIARARPDSSTCMIPPIGYTEEMLKGYKIYNSKGPRIFPDDKASYSYGKTPRTLDSEWLR